MKRSIRVKDGEDLSESNVQYVLNLLEQDNPITKKEACSILNISYNTTRLNRILEEFKEKQEYAEKRRKEMRSQPLTAADKSFIVSSYLEEQNLSQITESTFRSLAVIKRVLEQYHIPLRNANNNYRNPVLLDVNALSDNYTNGDLVYSARYDQPAYISKKVGENYRIWLIKDEQYAYQPDYELGDLRKVQEELSIKIETRKFWDDPDMQRQIAEAIINANKRKNKSE